jgi:hypothetical protein
MQENRQENNLANLIVSLKLALFILTIVLAQQIINCFFPDEDSPRVIAKMVIDTSLVVIGLGVHHPIVGQAILYAGIARFLLIFFQLQGMDPALRLGVIVVILVALFAVGYMKFGKKL